ncbi:MAG: L,D-transpeptidase family protein [Halomonas subglaciescola]|nr:L,D-transpeptidase family protein [Halomonas subglaciescola]
MNKTRPTKRPAPRVKAVGLAALALSAGLAAWPVMAETLSASALEKRIATAEAQGDTLPVAAFYQRLQQPSAWQTAAQVDALVEALETLKSDGLAPADYLDAAESGETLNQAFERSQAGDDQARAAFEVRATEALLLALEHLQRGRLSPAEIEPGWETPAPRRTYSMARVATAVTDGNLADALALARPDTAAYRQLREALIDYRALAQTAQTAQRSSAPLVPARDDALRRDDDNEDVATLRRRLAYWGMDEVLFGDPDTYAYIDIPASNATRFDAGLEAAVKRFQRRHLLSADGVVGGKTRRALNGSLGSHVDTLRANLERARWMQPVMARRPGVWVDIAGYRMHYTRPDGERWSSRVVVGSARRKTPVIHSAITHFTVNPTWTVPPTIWREDVQPKLKHDTSYLARRNMQVLSADGARLDPEAIDWRAPGNVMLRQSAGAANPLGRVVVRFPNSQLIYLHDTPAQGLFTRDRRALSSGCVRVEGVRELVRMLLKDTGSRYRLSELLQRGKSDLNVNLPERVPVALVYLTAWPDATGQVTFRPDIYRRDATLLNAL